MAFIFYTLTEIATENPVYSINIPHSQRWCQCPASSLEGCSGATSDLSASTVKLWLV